MNNGVRSHQDGEESKTDHPVQSLQDSMAVLKQVDRDYKPKLTKFDDLAASEIISNPFKAEKTGTNAQTNTLTTNNTSSQEARAQTSLSSIDKSVALPIRHSLHVPRIRTNGDSYLEYLKKNQVDYLRASISLPIH